jgi:hypothetical protein
MFGKRPSEKVQGSSGPHRFVEPPDARLGLALAGGIAEGQFSESAAFLVAGASVRPRRCGLRGCGRLREDPLHWPAE